MSRIEALSSPPMEDLLERLRKVSDAESLATDDPAEAIRTALECADLGVRALHRAAEMELTRRPMLAGLVQTVMDETGAKKTPAEDEARSGSRYVAYVREMEAYGTMGQHFTAHAAYYRQRAELLTTLTRQVA
jgi:hypothetical protein